MSHDLCSFLSTYLNIPKAKFEEALKKAPQQQQQSSQQATPAGATRGQEEDGEVQSDQASASSLPDLNLVTTDGTAYQDEEEEAGEEDSHHEDGRPSSFPTIVDIRPDEEGNLKIMVKVQLLYRYG